jgi:adenylate kinase
MVNLILFGPPGSGKGTQAARLVTRYSLMHISTGDLFRYEMGNNTPLGLEAKEYMASGRLVPDSVTMGMLENKINMHPDVSGFIFDGVPRTIAQAEILDGFLGHKGTRVNALLALQVDEEEIVRRILSRGANSGRPDDSDESVIRKRIEVYREETTPVFDYYARQQRSFSIDTIFSELCDRIDQSI